MSDENSRKQRIQNAAERALSEAKARRRIRDGENARRPRELNGRDGPDPARYGDWEKDGIASDF